MPEYTDKRRFPRIASEILVRVIRLDTADKGDLFVTQTIGLGGCQVVQEKSLGIKTPLRLVFCLGDEVIEAKGRSVYEIARKDGCFDVGIEFLELPPDDRRILQKLFRP